MEVERDEHRPDATMVDVPETSATKNTIAGGSSAEIEALDDVDQEVPVLFSRLSSGRTVALVRKLIEAYPEGIRLLYEGVDNASNTEDYVKERYSEMNFRILHAQQPNSTEILKLATEKNKQARYVEDLQSRHANPYLESACKISVKKITQEIKFVDYYTSKGKVQQALKILQFNVEHFCKSPLIQQGLLYEAEESELFSKMFDVIKKMKSGFTKLSKENKVALDAMAQTLLVFVISEPLKSKLSSALKNET